jgi:hypothetical protein
MNRIGRRQLSRTMDIAKYRDFRPSRIKYKKEINVGGIIK